MNLELIFLVLASATALAIMSSVTARRRYPKRCLFCGDRH